MSKLNLKTVKAYHIRENFQGIYKEVTKERFEKSLKKWYFWATHSRIYEMIDAARMVNTTGQVYYGGMTVRLITVSLKD